MPVNPTGAMQAYAQALQTAAGAAASPAPDPAGGADFGALLSGVLSDAVGAAKAGEQKMTAAATGQMSLVDVVTAVAEAEVTLETVVAVRDRVVQAYQDIMRMPI